MTVSAITSSSAGLDKLDATWIVRPGLANPSCVSLESRSRPGTFLRHYAFRIRRQPADGTAIFRADATFCPTAGKNGTGTSFVSFNYPAKLLRHYNGAVYIAENGGIDPWERPVGWADDVSWAVTSPWAP